MRQSTREKLFKEDERPFIAAEFSDERGNRVTQIIVDSTCAIVTEYPNERDGFDVYVRASGNTINEARSALGLQPID